MADTVYPGNATPDQVLANQKFCAGTNYNVAGTMPENGQKILVPSGTATVPIPAGHHDGTGYVQQVNVPAASVLTGTTIAGVNGTMPENGALGRITPGTADIAIPAGHTSGGTVAGDPNLLGQYILSGKSIFGVAGTAVGSATGTVNCSSSKLTFQQGANHPTYYYINVAGLGFTPSRIYLYYKEGTNNYYIVDTVYDSTYDYGGVGVRVSNASGNSPVDVDGTACYINNGSFQLPVYSSTYGNSPYAWIAVR